jgi:hypothetical protein
MEGIEIAVSVQLVVVSSDESYCPYGQQVQRRFCGGAHRQGGSLRKPEKF